MAAPCKALASVRFQSSLPGRSRQHRHHRRRRRHHHHSTWPLSEKQRQEQQLPQRALCPCAPASACDSQLTHRYDFEDSWGKALALLHGNSIDALEKRKQNKVKRALDLVRPPSLEATEEEEEEERRYLLISFSFSPC